MSDNTEHLLKLHVRNLIFSAESGVIMPVGVITSIDYRTEGIVITNGTKECTLTIEDLKLSRTGLAAELIRKGVPIANKEISDFKEWITRCCYLDNVSLLKKLTKLERHGFVNGRLVFGYGGKVFIGEAERSSDEEFIALELPYSMQGAYGQKGCKKTYEKVILHKSAPHFVVIAILIALAGSLIELVGIDGGGFHIFAESGVGKTILLCIAASVMGSASAPDKGSQESSYAMSWGATKNGIEAKFKFFNNGIQILDEIIKYISKQFGSDIYAITGGSTTVRMNAELEVVEKKSASFSVLSSGELSLQQMIKLNGEKMMGQGKFARLASIPMYPNDINYPEIFASAEKAANIYEETIADNSGFLFEEFIQALLNFKTSYDELKASVNELFKTTLEELKGSLPCKGSIETRVLKRFALMVVAGQLAHEFGLLPWPKDKIYEAVSYVYNRYYGYSLNRFTDAERAVKSLKEKLQREQGNFIPCRSDKVPFKSHGYIDPTHYFVYKEVFEKWIGIANPSEVVKQLKAMGLLKHEAKRNTYRTTEHLPSNVSNRKSGNYSQNRETFYCIDRRIVSIELD